MNFPLYIAKRYLRSASKNNAINIINRIASLGIIVGAMALFVVLSVFSGLVDFSLSFSNSIDPDLKAEPKTGKSYLLTPQQEQKIKNIPGLVSYSKVIEERVLFVFNGKEQVTYLKGVDSAFTKVSTIKKSVGGLWLQPHTVQAVVGYGISEKLGLGLLDVNNPLEVYVPKPGKGQINSPGEAFNRSVLVPVGIYTISEELDGKYVFTDYDASRELLGYKLGQVSAIEFKLKRGTDPVKAKAQLAAIFNGSLSVKDRAQLNDALYKMLNTENIVLYLIFTLVIIIALFNLVGALIMMVLDKKNNLKTLFNVGAEVKDLRRIFLLQGTLLTVFGGLIGLVLGSIVVLVQQQFKLVMITPTLAYPVVFSVQNLLIVFATIVSLGFLASLIASSRVSRRLLE